MNFKFDSKKVNEERTFTPLPVGDYDVTILSSEFGYSSNQQPMITLEFTVQNDPTNFKNRVIKEYYVMSSEVAQNKLGRVFQLLGYNLDGLIDIKAEIENDKLIGHTFKAKVGQRSYTSKTGQERTANTINNIKALVKPNLPY